MDQLCYLILWAYNPLDIPLGKLDVIVFMIDVIAADEGVGAISRWSPNKQQGKTVKKALQCGGLITGLVWYSKGKSVSDCWIV